MLDYDVESYARNLAEFYVKCHMTAEVILESRSLKNINLLIEQADLSKIVSDTKEMKKRLQFLASFFEEEGATDVSKELKLLATALPNPDKLLASAYGDDPAVVKKLSQTYLSAAANASNGVATIINATIELQKALTPFYENLDEEDRKLTIGELASKTKTDKDIDFIPQDKLEAGLAKAFVPGAAYKDRFIKGSKAASAEATQGGKSAAGKFFGTAFKFLAGFFAKPAQQQYPKLLAAYKSFVFNSSFEDFMTTADKIKVNGSKTVTIIADVAADATSNVGAAAAGAEVSETDQLTNEEEKSAPQEDKEVQKAAEQAVEQSKEMATSSTMGKSIHKAVSDYIKPFSDRKSLSGKKKTELQKSAEELNVLIKKSAAQSGKHTSDSMRNTLEKWFNGLDPSLQKSLGGAIGSKKVLQVAAKNLDDIIATNFNVEESSKKRMPLLSEVLLPSQSGTKVQNDPIKRWQKLAGIK